LFNNPYNGDRQSHRCLLEIKPYRAGPVLILALLIVAAGVPYVHAASPPVVNLGTAGNFAILSESGITDVPLSAITGNVGTSPITGAAITGLTCAEVTGTIFTVDAAGPPCRVIDLAGLGTAVLDMQTAYTSASAPATPCVTNEGVTDLNGQTLTTGVYCWTGTLAITGGFTISGSSSDVFIFQVPGTLTVSPGVIVTLSGGATSSNIFWVVGGATTIETTVSFQGTILDATNIAMQSGASLNGRALAQTAVTLIMNTITAPGAVSPPATTTTHTTLTCVQSNGKGGDDEDRGLATFKLNGNREHGNGNGNGNTFQCTAKVTADDGSTPTGSVTFTSSDAQGTFTNLNCSTIGNTLTCTVDYATSSTGTQTITATYSGDATHSPSSATFTLTIPLTGTRTSLTCRQSDVKDEGDEGGDNGNGNTFRCTARVTAKDGSTPTGSVTFTSSDSNGKFGTVTCATRGNNGDGRSVDKGEGQSNTLTCTVDYTPSSKGTQTITATYSGDATHSPSSATFKLHGDRGHGDDSPVLGSSPLLLNTNF
jgi:hypothetical protein